MDTGAIARATTELLEIVGLAVIAVGTVAVALTLQSVAFLGLIVLIRTFLSFSLEVELQGRWPWQAHHAAAPNRSSSAR